jgi:mono/diheme cytochrome c family protein
MKFKVLSAAVAGLLAAASVAQPPAPVSFRRDISPLFANRCAVCHMKEGPDAGMILEPRFAYVMIVGVPSTESPLKRVAPGDPDHSYLLLKMQNRQREVGGSGNKMPIFPGGVGFGNLSATPAEIALVRAWILAGAPDN